MDEALRSAGSKLLFPVLLCNQFRILPLPTAGLAVGTCLMPPLFGLIANHITVSLFPLYLLAILILMIFMHEALLRRSGRVAGEAAS